MRDLNERIVLEVRPSWKGFFGKYIFVVLLMAYTYLTFEEKDLLRSLTISAFLSLLLLLFVPLHILTNKLIVTTRRVIHKSGLIVRNTTEVEMKEIRSIDITQGSLQKIVGIGNIFIALEGHEGYKIILTGVKDPMTIKKTVRVYQ